MFASLSSAASSQSKSCKTVLQNLGSYRFLDHRCHCQQPECGENVMRLDIQDMQATPVTSFACYGEPLVKVLRDDRWRQVDRDLGNAMGIGLPAHEFAVLELERCPEPGLPAEMRWLRLDYTADEGGTVIAKLCPSLCAACRADFAELGSDVPDKDGIRLVRYWECKFKKAASSHLPSTDIICGVASQFEQNYDMMKKNCKAFICSALEELLNRTPKDCLNNAWSAFLNQKGQAVKVKLYEWVGSLAEETFKSQQAGQK